MKGIYKIWATKPDVIALIRKSLDRDGIPYLEEIKQANDGRDYVVIRAEGQAKHRRRSEPKPNLGGPLTLAQCERHLKQSREKLNMERKYIRGVLRSNWHPHVSSGRYDHYWNWTDRTEYLDGHEIHYSATGPQKRRMGQAIARVLARNNGSEPFRFTKADYEILDSANGRPVMRQSKLPARVDSLLGYLAGYNYTHRRTKTEEEEEIWPDPKPETAVESLLRLKADVAYWEEMTRLAGERERSKRRLAA